MSRKPPLEVFAPPFQKDTYSEEEKWHLEPFFTNLEKSVYVPLLISPELIGALCSRTSRATKDLRRIYLNEYVHAFVQPERSAKDSDTTWREKVRYGEALKELITFLHRHPIKDLFANPRARSFYIKWLAQYGDDSIAQMAGAHLVFSGISQIAIKHFEDQRIGLAPIEKSTRYVDYTQKIDGKYLYYTDPTLKDIGLLEEYEIAMNGLFETYIALRPQLTEWLTKKFPNEKASVVEKKAFDTLRGLLPTATLSQVAFFGNGQAFEHMINRSATHVLGEIRWAAEKAYQELYQITPSFLRRIKDEENKDTVQAHQDYLAGKERRAASLIQRLFGEETYVTPNAHAEVQLIEYDPEGEDKILTGILYTAAGHHQSWKKILKKIRTLDTSKKQEILDTYLEGRTARWQKVGRAFENVYVRFETTVNIGAWRDLQRHRMLTQQRQYFSCHHGYDTPEEIIASGLQKSYTSALHRTEEIFQKIEQRDSDLAQYAVTLAHRIRFMQWENLRQVVWKMELRTIPEGHPDYRDIEQQKFHIIKKIYPLIAERIMVNLGTYNFARRGQEERIQKKLRRLQKDI